jgi:hypothetical protein
VKVRRHYLFGTGSIVPAKVIIEGGDHMQYRQLNFVEVVFGELRKLSKQSLPPE